MEVFMNRSLLLAAVLFSTPAFGDDAWTHFGNPFTVTDSPVSSVDLLKDPSQFNGKTVMVEGRIADVCQKAGCWLVLAEGDKSIRIRTKAHRFFVAKDSAGKTAKIEGLVKSHKVDAQKVAHYESESSEGAVIPEKQAKSDMVFELIASGVSIKD
jgi:hypothetical protein